MSQASNDTSQTTPERYFLGVDGGASKTLAIITDDQGNELGRGRAGSSNHCDVGLDRAVEQILRAVEEAAHAVGCYLPLESAWLGIAGIDVSHDHEMIYPHLRSLANVVRLTNDGDLLLSGLDNATGVALIAGTGSIALGQNAHGTRTRAGGWGDLLGDEGSGYDLGHQALLASVRAADGRGQATMLLELILEHWQLRQPIDLIAHVYPHHDKATIAALTILVFKAACAQDPVACEIVQRGAEELALMTLTVSKTLDFASEPLPLALGGSLLLHQRSYREQVLTYIHAQQPIGQLALVTEPALSAARASIVL